MKYADRQGLFKRLFGSKRKRIIPSNARFLLADLFGSPDKVFTEEDLTSNELDYLKTNLKNIIRKGEFVDKDTVAIKPGGKYRGSDSIMGESNLLNLIVKSFDPEQSLKTALGRSTLDLSGGQAVIKDMYDFEVEPTAYKNMSFMDLLRNSKIDGDKLGAFELASFIAGKFGSDAREGERKPGSINLGSLDDLGIDEMDLLNFLAEDTAGLQKLLDSLRKEFTPGMLNNRRASNALRKSRALDKLRAKARSKPRRF